MKNVFKNVFFDIALSTTIITVAVLSVIVIMIFKNEKPTKTVKQDLGNFLTGTVELTISKDMLDLFGDDFDYKLSEEQKNNGFTGIVKNKDGSVTYTVKKKDYDKFIKEYKQQVSNTINELTSNGSFNSIEKIEHTDSFDKITIIANKEKFENSFDSMCIMSCGLSSMMYQMFDVNAPGKCTVEIKDSATDEVFQTTVYPEALNTNK